MAFIWKDGPDTIMKHIISLVVTHIHWLNRNSRILSAVNIMLYGFSDAKANVILHVNMLKIREK